MYCLSIHTQFTPVERHSVTTDLWLQRILDISRYIFSKMWQMTPHGAHVKSKVKMSFMSS